MDLLLEKQTTQNTDSVLSDVLPVHVFLFKSSILGFAHSADPQFQRSYVSPPRRCRLGRFLLFYLIGHG